jgi:hypothetical protein
MRYHILAAVACTALLAIAGPATAQERMRPVGSVTYEPEPSAPEIGVFQIRPEDRRMRRLRIQADEGSADVRSLKVKYADGETEKVRVNQLLKDGERSAIFELEEVRPIRSVEITYIPKGAVTLVLLSEGRRPEPAPPPPQPAQWKELSCKNVGLLADRDLVELNLPDKFRALRLRSANYDIEMIEMNVRYAEGGRDNYQIRTLIPAGGRIGPIELRPPAKSITRLEFAYRARTIGPFKTKLCVDGLTAPSDDED